MAWAASPSRATRPLAKGGQGQGEVVEVVLQQGRRRCQERRDGIVPPREGRADAIEGVPAPFGLVAGPVPVDAAVDEARESEAASAPPGLIAAVVGLVFRDAPVGGVARVPRTGVPGVQRGPDGAAQAVRRHDEVSAQRFILAPHGGARGVLVETGDPEPGAHGDGRPELLSDAVVQLRAMDHHRRLRQPALAALMDEHALSLRATLAHLLHRLGVPDPEQASGPVAAMLDGLVRDRIAGPSAHLSEPAFAASVRRCVEALLRGLAVGAELDLVCCDPSDACAPDSPDHSVG